MLMTYAMKYDAPVGSLTILSDGESITQVLFANQACSDEMIQTGNVPILQQAEAWLDCYFSGEKPQSSLKLKPEGTPFQQKVWQLLSEIPYGHVVTYGELATKIAKQLGKSHMSAQAVGGAVGRNPISIIVPCHRVVGKDGSLTGFGGTIDNKIKLLQLEGVNMSALYRPKYSTKP